MSAGHPHKRPNQHHPGELRKLLSTGGAPELMQRWQRLDVDHDIHDLAGYNVPGTVRYLDRDFFHALLDPKFAEHLGIGPIDTGLTPEQTVKAILQHEGVEKVLLDADNNVDTYEEAHELATCAEHELVRKEGGKPVKYEDGLEKAIKFCEAKVLHKPPRDLDCAPMIDEPDAADKRALKQLQALGVVDAGKLAKEPLEYSKSTSADQCVGCRHWQGHREMDLSPCALVAGLVRKDRWCKRYEKA